MEERLHSHYESLQRVIRFTRQADAKAAPIIALQIALVGALATRLDRLLPIATQGPWCLERVLLVIGLALYVVCLGAAAAIAAWVYFPRTPKSGGSLIYFEDIAVMRRDWFEERAGRMTADEIERQLLDQIHRVSQIASTKMRLVRWAFLLSVPSVILWLALFVWGSVHQALNTGSAMP